MSASAACYHLPGLFEFYDFYRVFLPLFRQHREYFYDWCRIASLYGAPADCIWGGGRVGSGDRDPREVLALTREYGISARLTFSNSLLRPEHLSDPRCNRLCRLLAESPGPQNGVIVHSDLLLEHLRRTYPGLYFVSSTTKVLTDFSLLRRELERPEFRYVVADFRLNRAFRQLGTLPQALRDKTELLCNECCAFGCRDRAACYRSVSRENLGLEGPVHRCTAPDAAGGYRFSRAMENPGFIGVNDIRDVYLPMGFSQFKIEGRSLGTALLLEFLLHYLTRPEYHISTSGRPCIWTTPWTCSDPPPASRPGRGAFFQIPLAFSENLCYNYGMHAKYREGSAYYDHHKRQSARQKTDPDGLRQAVSGAGLQKNHRGGDRPQGGGVQQHFPEYLPGQGRRPDGAGGVHVL